MGKILVTNSIKKDVLTDEVVFDESNIVIEIQDEVDRVCFHTFLYCASAIRAYPFEVPYDADSLDEFDLSETPSCSFCTFKDSERWSTNTNNNQTVNMDAYKHHTSLYRELQLNGSLKNTTYLEIIEEYQKCDERSMGPFCAGHSIECPRCEDTHCALHISPSLDELQEEERERAEDGSVYCCDWFDIDELQTIKIYITQDMKDACEKELDKCLTFKTFEPIFKLIINHGAEYTEVARRLMTPKHKKHFMGIGIPVKFNKYKKEWKAFLES
jgi:hypothetical protein